MKMRALYFVKTNQSLNKEVLHNLITENKQKYSKKELLRFIGILAKEYLVIHDDNNLYLCIEELTNFAKNSKLENLVDREVEYLFSESISCKRSYNFRFQFLESLSEKNIYHATISQFFVENPESNSTESYICVSNALLEFCYEALSISIDKFKTAYDLSITILIKSSFPKKSENTVITHRYFSIRLDNYIKEKPSISRERVSVYDLNKKRGFFKDLHPDTIARFK